LHHEKTMIQTTSKTSPKIEPKKNISISNNPKVSSKQNVPLTQIQSLLKATITPKAAQTQRISLGTDRQKNVEASSRKPLQISSTIKSVVKQQSTSQSILLAGQVLGRDHKSKQSLSPKRVEQTQTKEPTFPMTAAQVLKVFASQLTDYEKGEILDYKDIYFIGRSVLRKEKRNMKEGERNFGFDDDKGDYNAYVGEQVGYRYEIIDMLGKGSFGQAIKCFDHKVKEHIALKIIRSKKRFYHQATVEVKILKYIKDNDTKNRSNVVKMLDYFTFRKHIVQYILGHNPLLVHLM